jgi:hypothetical protein
MRLVPLRTRAELGKRRGPALRYEPRRAVQRVRPRRAPLVRNRVAAVHGEVARHARHAIGLRTHGKEGIESVLLIEAVVHLTRPISRRHTNDVTWLERVERREKLGCER